MRESNFLLDEAADSLRKIARAFDAKEPSLERVRIYYEQLSHLTRGQFESVCNSSVKNLDRFPTIAQLRKIAFESGFVRQAMPGIAKENPWIVFECHCLESAAFSKYRFAEMPDRDSLRCRKCGVRFEIGFVRKILDSTGFASAAKDHGRIPAQMLSKQIFRSDLVLPETQRMNKMVSMGDAFEYEEK